MSDHRWDGGDSSRIEALEARVVELEAEGMAAAAEVARLQRDVNGWRTLYRGASNDRDRERTRVVELTAALRDLVATTDLRAAPEELKKRIGQIVRDGERAALAAAGEGDDQ